MSQKVDLSGVHRFWEIVSIFESGKDPDEEKWDGLFDTPGYNILTKVEFSEEFFKRMFRLAFSSDRSEEMNKIEKEFVEHLEDVENNREQLDKFLGDIFTQDYYDEALDLAFEWLPFDDREPYPLVSFLFFQIDARGYIPIVFDLQFAYELEEDLSKFLAHEMHHFYRNLQVSFDPNIEDKEIIWAINQIHMEGVADQINREFIFGDVQVSGENYQHEYVENYKNAERYIEELDDYIKKYDKNNSRYGEKIKNSLPLSGHPIGFFMAENIIDSGSKEELIDIYDDPFYFFELYNRAAEKNNLTKFSHGSIEVIKDLKEKHF